MSSLQRDGEHDQPNDDCHLRSQAAPRVTKLWQEPNEPRGSAVVNLQDELAIAQQEIEQANETLAKAVRELKSARGSDSQTVAALETVVNSAKKALTAAEIRLRTLYESKDDGE